MHSLAVVVAVLIAGTSQELSYVRDGWVVLDGTRVARGGSPAWSVDGRLAFVRDGWIWVRGVGRLARGESPAWSPDGRSIAFARAGELFVIRADGGRAQRLTRKARIWTDDRTPSWSPDGKRLVFASSRAGFFNQELYLIGANGRGLVRLTHTAGSANVLGDDGMPSWSPDGSRIVFVSNRERNFELYTLRPDGTGLRRLTRTADADESLPRWSPDDRRIAFAFTPHGGRPELRVLDIATGQATRVGPGDSPAWHS